MRSPDVLPRAPGSIWVFACYLLLLGLIAFATRDVSSEPDAWAITVDRLINPGIGLGDPTSFATGALDIYETGWVRPEHAWIFNLWPPGLPLIEAASLTVSGRDAPVLAILQGLAVILHSSVALALYATLRRWIDGRVALIVAILPYAFPLTRVYLLQPTGVALGETFAVGFFALGMLASISAISRPSYLRAVAAGVALALSAYVRSQFEIILTVQAMVAAVLLLLALTGFLRRLPDVRVPTASLLCLLLIVVSTQSAMLPWRILNLLEDGTPRWVSTSVLEARNAVAYDDELTAAGGDFVVRGGGTVVCKVAPETCGKQEQAQSLFFRTFLAHPVEWIRYKASLLPTYWFAPVGDWASVGRESSPFDIAFNSTFALAIVTAFALAFASRRIRLSSSWIALVLFNGTLLLAHGAISVFVHFEARYLYFPKIMGTMLVLIEISILLAQWSTKDKPVQ